VNELIIDPARMEDWRNENRTRIPVRAKTADGKWLTVDIACLTHASLTDWLRSSPAMAERVVLLMLGHES
jgi:hypothetical protein